MTNSVQQDFASAPEGELRKFGLVMAAFLILVFGLFLPWVFATSLPLWPYPVAAVFAALAIVKPGLLRQVYVLWMHFALRLGKINSAIILGAVFVVLVAPLGWALRLAHKLQLQKRIDPQATSYRSVRDKPITPESMERPF
ncbi:hypothetical protein EUZ85_03560 [Hahella sp. KA22]|uniref:SxtJ family membrane protein n=1 Tax=Hahella sp. KA22 TaxID=1628392 RepID=UPI000FDD53BC|nr:SxtJ family membrane protein [Hahella sp. KA22]AZZ89833.1 hypothetical protein ENC22_01015 [Hahella sp. KA22]QAY53202.1 hypothetical protein EUZ85_03560 [Hahella sp. KA22]